MDGKPARTRSRSGNHTVVAAFGLPPEVRELSLARGLARRVSYWGVRRTYEAYEKMVRAGIDAGRRVIELEQLAVEIAKQQERWRLVDASREMVRRQVQMEFIDQEMALRTKQMELQKVRAAHALVALQEEIVRNEQAARLHRSRAELAKAKQERAKAEGAETRSNVEDQNAGLRKLHRSQEIAEEERKRLIKLRGGEEFLTETDHDFIENVHSIISAEMQKYVER